MIRLSGPALQAFFLGAAFLFFARTPLRADEPQQEGIAFFESKIRPILVAHCYECHSGASDPLQAGLRLDTKEGTTKGGDSGPIIMARMPDASLLMEALRYESFEMPPSGKLPPDVVADFERWIAMGAPDPRVDQAPSAPAKNDKEIAERIRSHWAFQPIKAPPTPRVDEVGEWENPIDVYVEAKLAEKGIDPSPPAEKQTLLKRLYVDLIGLPPSYDDVKRFADDRSPDATDRVIDSLLASPAYGERWGRHWLDVARYADTKDGVLMYGDDRIRPYAYTYRDYVIQAWNEDLPFDQFIVDQLAADQEEPAVEPWRLGAMGFLTLGRIYCNKLADQVDDQIDTVSRGLIGMTVACARCHDHKYDPIPQADYYSLYGIFASSEPPFELPRTRPDESSEETATFEETVAQKRAETLKFREEQFALLTEDARQRTPDYLVEVATTKPDLAETAIFDLSLRPEDLRPPITARWRRVVAERAKPDDPVFGLWSELISLPEENFAPRAAEILSDWLKRPRGHSPGQLNPLVAEALEKATLNNPADVARCIGQTIRDAYEHSKSEPPVVAGTSAGVSAESMSQSQAVAQLASILTSESSPTSFPLKRTVIYMSRGPSDHYRGQLNEMEKMAVQSPHSAPRAMVLNDAEELCDPKIFVRGNPNVTGKSVPRQFLSLFRSPDEPSFSHGSGRIDLARAITDPSNPLTRRVIVNRVWMHHLGKPIVDSPSNFGFQTPEPIHRDLLDFLAAEVLESNWSMKTLHRLILSSRTYRQSSADRPDASAIDPENNLLWKANRTRLDLESMRDSMLAVAGDLDLTMLGRPVNIAGDPACRRRTLYGLVDRQSLPTMYRSFDFASPDLSAEQRPNTTVPQQALFALNNPFVAEQARRIAAGSQVAGAASTSEKVIAMYRTVYARDPSNDEVQRACEFVGTEPPPAEGLSRLEELAQVLLITNEFMFLD